VYRDMLVIQMREMLIDRWLCKKTYRFAHKGILISINTIPIYLHPY